MHKEAGEPYGYFQKRISYFLNSPLDMTFKTHAFALLGFDILSLSEWASDATPQGP